MPEEELKTLCLEFIRDIFKAVLKQDKTQPFPLIRRKAIFDTELNKQYKKSLHDAIYAFYPALEIMIRNINESGIKKVIHKYDRLKKDIDKEYQLISGSVESYVEIENKDDLLALFDHESEQKFCENYTYGEMKECEWTTSHPKHITINNQRTPPNISHFVPQSSMQPQIQPNISKNNYPHFRVALPTMSNRPYRKTIHSNTSTISGPNQQVIVPGFVNESSQNQNMQQIGPQNPYFIFNYSLPTVYQPYDQYAVSPFPIHQDAYQNDINYQSVSSSPMLCASCGNIECYGNCDQNHHRQFQSINNFCVKGNHIHQNLNAQSKHANKTQQREQYIQEMRTI